MHLGSGTARPVRATDAAITVLTRRTRRGRNVLLGLCVATMMVPMQMGIIPLYMMMSTLGPDRHPSAVILPTLVTAFGVFLMRQYISAAVPDELLDAGYVDGANTLQTFLYVVVPAADRPWRCSPC